MCRLLGPCQIIIFIYLMIQHPGYAAKRPVMTVIPNYNKILTGEKITMTCDVESDASGCSWYHENILIYTGKDYVISMTEIRHSGDYRCQNSAGERSEIVTLNVTTGQVILQAPVYIYEGDDVSLRCYSPYFANQTIFYKNNQMIQNNDSDLLPIKSTDLTSTYRCSKQVLRTFSKTYSSDDTSITYTEGNSVIFTPEYNKLLTGENITMTYNGGLGVTHYWYKDSEKVAEGGSYRITSAQVGHSGVYDCRTKSRNSAKFRLDVSDGPVILQAPPLVYRGSDMVLRCHSRPGYRVINTTFYKDGDVIQPSTNDLATVIIPQNQQVGRYRCTRTLSWEEYVTYTDEVSLHIRELFPKPNISIEQNTVREGDNIICNTSLSLPQKGTLLQFTFYRDGQEVLNLNSSSKVLNVRLEDSGNYSCEVRTANNTGERKRSAELYIHIQELFSRPNLTTIQNPVTKGDAMILICNTSLSPLRQSTELQFAFYRDGQNVQKFSLSNQYVVQSTELEDSGNYSCDVRTPNNNVKKRSEEVSIQIKEYEHHSTAALVTISVITILLIIIIIINLIIVNKNKCKPLITSTSKRQTADPQETDSHRDLSAEGNVCYADIKINRKAPATHTASNEDLCYVNFTTSRTASSPTVVETQIIYSEIKPRTEI